MGMAVSIPSTEINSENAPTTNGGATPKGGAANAGKWAKLKSAVGTENPLVKKCGQLLSDRKE